MSKRIKSLIFEAETQTIRSMPENYCVAPAQSFAEGGSMDAAIENRVEVLRLMAAAPELLEALELVLGNNKLMNAIEPSTRRAVMDAVAKARGES